MRDLVAFFMTKKTQPKDRATLIHGDFKIDDLVFQKSEPRVIGIVDWKRSKIGYLLSDLCCLSEPFMIAARTKEPRRNAHPEFKPPKLLEGLPTREECIAWYAAAAGWALSPDIP
jgi:aminoglycoside phosphotransferase (APT) family kinase protein